MRMRNQDYVDGRQIAHVESGLPDSFQKKEPAREVGVNDHALSADLEEKAGVTDKRDAQLAVVHQLRLVSSSCARRHRGMSHQARKTRQHACVAPDCGTKP